MENMSDELGEGLIYIPCCGFFIGIMYLMLQLVTSF